MSQSGTTRDQAVANYSWFVPAGMSETSPLARTCHQMLLGDDDFVSAHQQSQRSDAFKDTPRQQRRSVTLSLAQYHACYSDRNEAMVRAYLSQEKHFNLNNNCIRVIAVILKR
ncbi:hypothetical protein [Janthinobacterium sp. RT4P48]|uniref:hypothetical protein n=1 Tax=Janthinobacterium sp. RT4P48 TaxID=3424188 RepID=UPI003F26DD76